MFVNSSLATKLTAGLKQTSNFDEKSTEDEAHNYIASLSLLNSLSSFHIRLSQTKTKLQNIKQTQYVCKLNNNHLTRHFLLSPTSHNPRRPMTIPRLGHQSPQ